LIITHHTTLTTESLAKKKDSCRHPLCRVKYLYRPLGLGGGGSSRMRAIEFKKNIQIIIHTWEHCEAIFHDCI
jgi:hypothetical protein